MQLRKIFEKVKNFHLEANFSRPLLMKIVKLSKDSVKIVEIYSQKYFTKIPWNQRI